MGTGTSLRGPSSHQTHKLSSIEQEKVSNIVEICNVSRDEALRVLDACHMDETMAIERFLNGTEVSTWSQVSKKKRQTTQSRVPSGSRAGHGSGRAHDRDREVEGDRRDRDRSSSYSSDFSNPQNGYRRGARHHGQSQRSREPPSGVNRKRNPQGESKLNPPSRSVLLPEQTDSWITPSKDESWVDHGSVNGVPGESWSDTNAPSTDPWTDKNPAGGHPKPSNGPWNASCQTSAGSSSIWPVQNATDDADKDQDAIGDEETTLAQTTTRPVESPKRQAVNPLSTVKRTFNYAAAAAAGTSHEKPASLPQEISTQAASNPSGASKPSVSEVSVPDSLEEVLSGEAVDTKKRRSRSGRKQSPRVESDRQSLEGNVETRQASDSHTELYESQRDSTAPKSENLRGEGVSHAAAWVTSSRPSNDADDGGGKHLGNNTAALAVASAGIIGSEQNTGDSLSLQFGSFGLGGLDGVNWSASEQKSSETVVNSIVSPETTVVQAAPTIAMQPSDTSAVRNSSIAPESSSVELSSTSLPASANIDLPRNTSKAEEAAIHPSTSSGALQVPSSGGGSGVMPVLPVGHGGNFAPANYGAPYLMPPLHGYSPAMTSYENGGDLGSSRAPSLVPPGSLPMYDPTTIPGMPAANGKYGGIPGLGDMSALQGVQPTVSKDGQHRNSAELEKSSSVTTSGLPAGMDPLAPPYMMPGYPSMQYPMYTFPTGPYGPPGMGPSPFPYPPPGQVSSQGGRAGFGFEDAPIGLTGSSRAGSALGESMYTPGYLNTSMNHSSSQKGSSDGSFKTLRGTPGNGIGAASMGGGMVPGMAYSDYQGGMPVVSSGVGTAGNAPGSWNSSRQHNGSRTESGNGPGLASNQTMTAASPSSSVYTAGPGTHGGYWGPQQGGYYQ